MTPAEQKLKTLLDQAHKTNLSQIVMDLVSEIEDALNFADVDEPLLSDTVGALAYDTDIIIDVIDTERFNADFQLLTLLYKALSELQEEIRQRNILLGIDINKG